MRELSSIITWQQSCGLLPIHLDSDKHGSKYIMLNGGNGDFCLQTEKSHDDEYEYYSLAWSTNSKNFVIVEEGNTLIHNWINKSFEKIHNVEIENNLEKFYSYLLSKSYRTEADVVPFIIDIFRKLRNITREKDNPAEAINLLYILLISIEEDNYTNIDTSSWGIGSYNIPTQFDYFVELLRSGVKSIKPKLDLILRHSSGILFQEAHKEVLYFNSQRDLFGSVSSALITKKDLYSSIHYTPQYIARSIVENCLKTLDFNKKFIKILDPACGSSEFLIEVLKQIKNLGYNGSIEINAWDSSESAVNTSKFLLNYEKKSQWSDERMQFSTKLVHDSLQEAWESDYDLILMNPPFVSWELLGNNDSREAVMHTFESGFKNKKPNQASAFLYKAIKSLNNDGIIGCVLPSSILNFDSYSQLRHQIINIININLIGKLGSFVFEDALTDVSIFVGQKRIERSVPTLIWSKNEKGIVQEALRDFRKLKANNEPTIEKKSHCIYTPTRFPLFKDSWKIISNAENSFLRNLGGYLQSCKLVELSSIFSVKQGIRQGIKNIFKISEDEYLNFDPESKKYFRPVVDNDAIKNGSLFKKNYIWYPYDKNGAMFEFETELSNVPFFINTIKPLEPKLKNRSGITDWWSHTRPRNWQFEKSNKLVSKEFGSSDSFALDSDGEFVVERGYAWIPKKPIEKDDYYFFLAFFSSSIFDKLLSIYSKQLAGGNWYDLGAKYVNKIPVPNILSKAVKHSTSYTKLVELGKELDNGNIFVKQIIDDVLTEFFYPHY